MAKESQSTPRATTLLETQCHQTLNYQALQSLDPISKCELQCLVKESPTTYQHHESLANNTRSKPEMSLSSTTVPNPTQPPLTEHVAAIVRYYKTSTNHQQVTCSPQY
jgi:hypothetical protein